MDEFTLKIGYVPDGQNFIRIWRWEDAPEEYKELCNQAGDEDWLMYYPASCLKKYYPLALESAATGDEDSYLHGLGHIARCVLENGDVIVSFAHA